MFQKIDAPKRADREFLGLIARLEKYTDFAPRSCVCTNNMFHKNRRAEGPRRVRAGWRPEGYCASLCIAVFCYAVLHYALLCFTLLCHALLCDVLPRPAGDRWPFWGHLSPVCFLAACRVLLRFDMLGFASQKSKIDLDQHQTAIYILTC